MKDSFNVGERSDRYVPRPPRVDLLLVSRFDCEIDVACSMWRGRVRHYESGWFRWFWSRWITWLALAGRCRCPVSARVDNRVGDISMASPVGTSDDCCQHRTHENGRTPVRWRRAKREQRWATHMTRQTSFGCSQRSSWVIPVQEDVTRVRDTQLVRPGRGVSLLSRTFFWRSWSPFSQHLLGRRMFLAKSDSMNSSPTVSFSSTWNRWVCREVPLRCRHSMSNWHFELSTDQRWPIPERSDAFVPLFQHRVP